MATEQEQEERYEIKGKIGEGGRGAVYCAYDRQLNRKVAIKRLFADPDAPDDGEQSYQAIIKESHALSAINSPHIVRVFDVATDEDGPYVVMEYLEGKTLHEIISSAPLVLQDFLTITEQALEALIAAHEAKLLHRDIKPGNLMLTWLPSGRIQLKLLDFGLAKFTEKPAIQTVAHKGSVLGSIYFMAPEQFERTPLDVRTDLYSLGCVLYHALTGRYPFFGDSPTEVMAAHIQADCTDLHTLRPDLSVPLCRWVMQLIARSMDDRPANAREALREFEEVRHATAPVSTEQVPNKPRLITGIEADTGTQLVTAGPLSGNQSVGGSQTTGHVPPHATTTHVPLHTATTTVVADPHTRMVKSKSNTVPSWVYTMAGVLMIFIVILGVATAMRGDPSEVPPPEAESPEPPPAEPPDAGAPSAEPPPAEAAPPEQPAEPPKEQWNAAREFRRKDKNADFVLSKGEFVTATTNPRKAQLEGHFARLDKNRDGQLTMSEFREYEGD